MIFTVLTNFAASCSGGTFLGFPLWHKYLDGITTHDDLSNLDVCTPKIQGLGDIWLIVAAVIEILLRLAAIAAVVFIVIGGVQFITSQGEPDKTAQARKTIQNALIGLVISVAATALVSFFAGRFNP